MIPLLAYPLALLALASLPALAAIYILRNRFRRRQVSSLVLWRFQVQSKEGGAKVHRLQLPLLFFLELLALLLLVTAATGPHWKLPQSKRPLIVVLDDSFSMRAIRENTSAQARAREVLEKMYRRQPPPSTRLILAGNRSRLLGAPVHTWSEVNALLAQWTCWSPVAALDEAITLASDMGKQQANLLILTDHAPPDEKLEGDRLRWQSFGAPLPNFAIVNASRTAHGEEDRCLLEIANLSSTPRSSQLLVLAGSNTVQRTALSLGPRERQRLVFSLPASVPVLEARLDPDALSEDNVVQLLPPIRKRVRVQLSLTNETLNRLVARTLDATGLRAAISESPELVIHQSDSTPAGSNAWSLRWLAPTDATAYTGPFVIDTAHPLAQGIALPGAVWAASDLTNAPGSVPLILAGNVPLLSVREDALSRRHLTLNLNPELSTVPNTPDWPVLFYNLLQWRAAETPGLLENHARLGAEVLLKTTGEPVTVTWPDGTVQAFPQTSDRLALETPLPGIYTIAMGQLANTFAVNPLAAEESDLSDGITGHWGEWREDAEQRFEERSVVWMIGLLALAVMAAHLGLIAVGRGGR
ncbi:MAG: BatA domain-containing protein [Verrucomicrobiae bacterium]|nr:BatA domain-containing protein [Verrucomicrobiae bacterium]